MKLAGLLKRLRREADQDETPQSAPKRQKLADSQLSAVDPAVEGASVQGPVATAPGLLSTETDPMKILMEKKASLLREVEEPDAPAVSQSSQLGPPSAPSPPEPSNTATEPPDMRYSTLMARLQSLGPLPNSVAKVLLDHLEEFYPTTPAAPVSASPASPVTDSPQATAETTHSMPIVSESAQMAVEQPTESWQWPDFGFTDQAVVARATQDYLLPSQYLKGIKWSPEGWHCLTNCEDNLLRIYQFSWAQADTGSAYSLNLTSTINEAETVYDYCWYPFSSSSVAGSSLILATCRDQPIHLWDASTSSLRASYRAYDNSDEIDTAYSLQFSPDSASIYAGFNNRVVLFDVSRPGRDCSTLSTVSKRSRQNSMKGIVSTIAVHPARPSLLALGTYSAKIGLVDTQMEAPLTVLSGHQNGITHMKISPDGNLLVSGTRKDNDIFAWDLRQTAVPVLRFQRQVQTNQRIYFDIDPTGSYLVTGSQAENGKVLVFSLKDGNTEPIHSFQAHGDAVNGCQYHPYMKILATTSGQRRFSIDGEEEDPTDPMPKEADNSLKIWSLS